MRDHLPGLGGDGYAVFDIAVLVEALHESGQVGSLWFFDLRDVPIDAGNQVGGRQPLGSGSGAEYKTTNRKGDVLARTIPELSLVVGYAIQRLGLIREPFDEIEHSCPDFLSLRRLGHWSGSEQPPFREDNRHDCEE